MDFKKKIDSKDVNEGQGDSSVVKALALVFMRP